MTNTDEYQFERGRLEQYRATLNQRMATAKTADERTRLASEGNAIVARLNAAARKVQQGEAARRVAASPSAWERFDIAVCVVRSSVFPEAQKRLWSLDQGAAAAPARVSGLQQLERRWSTASTPEERAIVAADAETLAREIERQRNASAVDFKMPGAVLDEMHTTAAVIEQLGLDIDHSSVDPLFKAGWRAFAAEWQQFYTTHQGWFDRAWYANYEKTVEYRRRAAEWRAAFEARGGHPTAPKDEPPDEKRDSSTLEKVALGASAALGIVALFNLFGRR